MPQALQQLSALRIEAEIAGGDKFVATAGGMAKALDDLEAAIQAGGRGFEEAEPKLRQQTGAYEKLKRGIDPAYSAQQQFAKGQKVLQRELDTGRISLESYNRDLAQHGQRYTMVNGQVTGFASNMTRGMGSARNMGNAVQQAGYQVGDFAVQIASGQGVLRPFIQQGTQLVSMFGPWGAVIGAAGAIVGAFAQSLWGGKDAAVAAEGSLALLEETIKGVEKATAAANETSRQAAFYDLRGAEATEAKARANVNAASAILAKAEAELSATRGSAFLEGTTGFGSPERTALGDIDAGRAALEAWQGEMDAAQSEILRLRDSMSGLTGDYAKQTVANEALIAAAKVSAHEYAVVALTQDMLKGKFAGTSEQARAQAEQLVNQREELDQLTGSAKKYASEATKNAANATRDLAVIEEQTRGTLELASAYGVSTEAGLRTQAAMKAREAGVKNAAVDEAALTKALLAQTAANQALAASQALVSARVDTQVAAMRAGAAAISDPGLQRQAELQISRQEQLNRLQVQYALELEKIPALMAEFDRKQAYDEQARFWNDVRGLAKGYAGDVKSYIVDGLTGATNSGKSLWSNLWDTALAGGKRFLVNFAAELATQKFVMPILMDLIGSNSSLFGIAQAAAGQGGSGGAGSMTGGLSSLSNLSSLASMFSSDGLIAQGANWASGVLGYGSIFGSGMTATAAAQAAGTVGAHAAPYIAGSATSAATGAAGSAGATGGLSAGLSAIPVWGWIAMAVMAAKQFTMGAEPTSAKGTLNTLLMPSHEEWMANPRRAIANLDPVGLALTDHGLPAFLTPGGMLNKLLGNSKPSNEGVAYVTEGMGEVSKPYFDKDEYNRKNDEASYELISAFAQLRDEIIGVTGGSFDQKVLVNVGSRDGVNSRVGDLRSRDKTLEGALDFLVNSFAKGITGVIDEDYKRILAMGGKASDVYENLVIAQQVKALGQNEDMKAATEQLAALIEQFGTLRSKALALGLAVTELDKAQAAQLRGMQQNVQLNFTASVHQLIDQYLTPLQQLQASISSSGQTTYDRFTAAQSLFREVAEKAQAGNTVALGMLAASGQAYADLARNLSSSVQPLREFMDTLNSGPLATLTPRQQLDAAQAKFTGLSARASAGDSSVIGDLQSSAQTYLQLARQYGASGQVYQDAYSEVTGALSSIITAVDGAIASVDPQSVLGEISTAIGPLISELTASQAQILAGIEPTLDDLNSNFRTQIAVMQDEGIQTRALLAQIATALNAVPGHAVGGMVRGRGGPASDSNLRWLSAGEYVMRSSSVERFGSSFFDRLNAGYLPGGGGGGSNDNGAVVQAIYSVGADHQRVLAELVAVVKGQKEEIADLKREIARASERLNLRAA